MAETLRSHYLCYGAISCCAEANFLLLRGAQDLGRSEEEGEEGERRQSVFTEHGTHICDYSRHLDGSNTGH